MGAIARKSNQQRKSIQLHHSDDLSIESVYTKHARIIQDIGQSYSSLENRKFEIDNDNKDVLRFLLYYFNNCKLAEKVFPKNGYKLHKNIILVGEPGTGKTWLMQIFSDYLRKTKNPNFFQNLSVTQMMNYYKLNSHIDMYTFNEINSKSREGNPFNICLHDIGLETQGQKHYGTNIQLVVDEFLFARYEIYQDRTFKSHLTSNLTVEEFQDKFEERLLDRFKSFNVIPLTGKSRRK